MRSKILSRRQSGVQFSTSKGYTQPQCRSSSPNLQGHRSGKWVKNEQTKKEKQYTDLKEKLVKNKNKNFSSKISLNEKYIYYRLCQIKTLDIATLVSINKNWQDGCSICANTRSDGVGVNEGRREKEETNITRKRIPVLELKAFRRTETTYPGELQALEEFNRNINLIRQY